MTGHAKDAGGARRETGRTKRIVRRIRKRSVRARTVLVTAALLFAGFWVFGLVTPGWLAPAGFLAIASAALFARRRRKLPNRLLRVGRGNTDAGAAGASAVVSALPDPALLMDESGYIIAQNAASEEIFGRRAAGDHITGIVRAPHILDAIERVRGTRQTVRLDHIAPVPLERHFEVVLSPVRGNRAGSILLVMRDLTRQERAERMRAEFVANASHELRTPLASLLGFVETLQSAARSDPAAQAKFLDIMRTEALRMSRLVDDLLSLSRIELNAHILPASSVDITRAITHVIDTLKPIALENGVEIEIIGAPGSLNVTGDRDELVQLFQNIVENAVKYGRDGGRVEVEFNPAGESANREIVVSVRDHGPGIAAEHLPRLTERFYRVEKSHSRTLGGTGLGLAIVKHIINRHRGRLEIESEVGKGTVLHVALPLAGTDANKH